MLAVTLTAAAAQLTLSVPIAPTPVESDGHSLLVYELHLANDSGTPIPVEPLTIADRATGRTIAAYDSTAITTASALAPGQSATLFVEIATEHAPARLSHRIGTLLLTLPVSRGVPVVLGPPLGAGDWVAVHSPEWPRGHRRVFYPVNGKPRLPGRFAIDFVGIDAVGRTTTGEPDLTDQAIGYGAPVLAGADAVVAGVRDGETESPRISGNGRHTPEAAAGNFVALALGGGRYAIYEHLRRGSVTVRAGQRVRRGDVIGALGFSGSSTGPHLHLHVADSPDPIGGEGLPFVIDDYTMLGRYADIGTLGKARWLSAPAPVRKRDWPGVNVVVQFSARK